jgi:hypothetical protein
VVAVVSSEGSGSGGSSEGSGGGSSSVYTPVSMSHVSYP